jgi:hypothetical protein
MSGKMITATGKMIPKMMMMIRMRRRTRRKMMKRRRKGMMTKIRIMVRKKG